MNKIRNLALIVLAGAAFSLFAQENADGAGTSPVQKAQRGKKGPQRPDGPRGNRRPMPFMAERLAAEYPAETEAIEKLKAADPEAAGKKMAELQQKYMDARRAEMRKTRTLAREYKADKSEANLKKLKDLLTAQYDKESALRKTMIAGMEKKIAADKAADKDVKDAGRALNRLKKMNDRILSEGKDEYIDKQIERLTADRKPGGKRGEGKRPGGGHHPEP